MGWPPDELRPGLRSLPIERYPVIYRVLEDAVEVVAVVHGSRDIETLFERGEEESG